jgi:monofunctional biosynthetic peptidoglycan transglycosylase
MASIGLVSSFWRPLLRWLALLAVAFVALQLYFVARVALMAVTAPQSTTFERSEAWRIGTEQGHLAWRQTWVPYEQISDHLKRAVIASEDGAFVNHDGVEWEAMEKAWQKNAKAKELADKQAKLEADRLAKLAAQNARKGNPKSDKPAAVAVAPANSKAPAPVAKPPKIVGGSTITQQLAKNLLLSGERTLLRKGQEFVLTLVLEALLDKRQILTLYLNHVEWGEGVFGAEAASQHYYRKSATQLSAYEAARLAVMLPRPRYFERLPNSGYLGSRAQTIMARMAGAELP